MLASGSARYRDPNYEIRSWILFWSLPATTLLWVSLRFSLMLKILALSIRTHVFSDSSLRRKSTLPGLKVVAEPCLMCSDLILEWLLQPGKGNAPNDWTSVRWPLHPRLRRTVKSIWPAFVDTGGMGYLPDENWGSVVTQYPFPFPLTTWNWNWLILNFQSLTTEIIIF